MPWPQSPVAPWESSWENIGLLIHSMDKMLKYRQQYAQTSMSNVIP